MMNESCSRTGLIKNLGSWKMDNHETPAADDLWPSDFFQEPSSFRPPSPQPTVIENVPSAGRSLSIRLLGAHPLWGHVLYPASVVLSRYIENHASILFPSTSYTRVLELGAGAGLPGLTSVLSGANLVVSTDFPDPDLISNLEWNANTNLPDSLRKNLIVKGLKWGQKLDGDIFHSTGPNSNDTQETTSDRTPAPRSDEMFDLILLADLLFNHSEHTALLKTCEASLRFSKPQADRPSPSLLVFYSHHRPWCVAADLEFFVIARHRGWTCTQVVKDTSAGLAFPADDGDPAVRGTVHGWILTRQEDRSSPIPSEDCQ